MTEAERWATLRDLFDRALALPVTERDAFLAAECADASLRAEVRDLLRASEADGPLDSLASRLTPVRDLFTEHVPETVGPYLVTGRIGEGGMGVVYRAHDPRLRRDVALKFLPATLQDQTPAAERLIGEARAASALDHPNICTIYDISSAGSDRLFIAMAYYGGGTLEDRLRAGPLPVAVAVDIALQIAAALQCAHEAGIVHRDVKPANIAFGERGEAKVLDFGVAVLTDTGDAAESAGTPSYMSPEQLAGGVADPRSDVWALGVVLYEMLTGGRPFAGASRDDVHAAIANAAPPGVTSLRRDVPAALAAAVARSLAKDPAERFQSAAEMAAALRSAKRVAVPAWIRRSAAVAAGVLLLVVVSAISRVRKDSAPPSEARLQLDEQYARAHERYVWGTTESNEAAIVILRAILARDSMHAPSRALLASAYAASTGTEFSRAGRTEWLDSAVVHANAAIAAAPSLPHGYAALGVAYRWSGRLEDAVTQHRQALARDPQFAMSMLELGFVNHLLRRHDDALIWLERGLSIEPDVPAARQYASALYRVFDMPGEALRHIATGRLVAPDDASLIWESVLIALTSGDTITAAANFDAYIQLQPAGERERMYAWYHILRDDPAAARVHIDRVNLDDAPWYDLREFGIALLRTGDPDRGAATLRRALADIDSAAGSPEWGRTNPGFDRAYIHAALGNREESIASLRQWVDNGGLRSWHRMETEWAWHTVADDPRFLEIVRRSGEEYQQKRARILAELSRTRD